MTKNTRNTATQADVEQLRGAIEMMDCLSQEGFSEIAAIAGLVLLAMQTPGGNDLEAIAQALRAIQSKAQDIENCINVEAEQVGCNYKDEDAEMRRNARRSIAAEKGGAA